MSFLATTTSHTNTVDERSTSSASQIRKLIDIIDQMAETDHEQVLRILNEHDCRYTENSNGVFINMSHVSTECIRQIQQFAQFWKDQNKHIHSSEQARFELQQILDDEQHTPSHFHDTYGQTTSQASSPCASTSTAIYTPHPEDNNMTTSREVSPSKGLVSHRAKRNTSRKTNKRPTASTKETNALHLHADKGTDSSTLSSKSIFESSGNDEQMFETTLTDAEKQLVQVPIASKRKQLSLNRVGKQLLKRGGATSRVARKCIASEDSQIQESHGTNREGKTRTGCSLGAAAYVASSEKDGESS